MTSSTPPVVSHAAHARSAPLGRPNWLAVAVSVSWVVCALSGCAIAPLDGDGHPERPPAAHVPMPPPAPLHEVVGPPPGPGFVWVSGYWVWSGVQHVWVSGHWLAMRPEHVWVQPVWQRNRHGWWLQGGGWRRHAAPTHPGRHIEPHRSPSLPHQLLAPRENGRRFMPMPAPAQRPATATPTSPALSANSPIQRSDRKAPQPAERSQDAQEGDERGKPILGWPSWKRNRGQEAQ